MRYKRLKNFLEDYYHPPEEIPSEIGHMALTCGSIEDIIHAIFWRYVDTYWEIAPILTGDEKPTRLAEDILKMAIALDEDPERIEDMRALFADFKELNEIRNKCLHWIWHPPKQHKRGRKHWLHPPSYKPKGKPTSFTLRQLKNINLDLAWVELRMRTHAMSEEDFERERADCAPQIVHLVVPAPWLDKHRKPGPIRWDRLFAQARRQRPRPS